MEKKQFLTRLTGKKMMVVLAFAVITFGNSCTKEGPAGPKGDAGAKGDTGAKGDPGAKGDTGTANVIYSNWFTPDAYVVTTVFGIKNFDYNKTAPGITQDVLDMGVVLTYGKLDGYTTSIWPTDQVSKLPIVVTYISGSTQSDTWSAFETVGNLRINFVNNINGYSSISTAHMFRYIIIPGGVSGNKAQQVDNPVTASSNTSETSASKLDYKSMTYDQVCDYYKIPK